MAILIGAAATVAAAALPAVAQAEVVHAFDEFGNEWAGGRELIPARPWVPGVVHRQARVRFILDHSEAKEDNDVTAMFYDSDPSIPRKPEMMWLWVEWLEKWARNAVCGATIRMGIPRQSG